MIEIRTQIKEKGREDEEKYENEKRVSREYGKKERKTA